MWEEIQNAVQSPEGHEQRKQLLVGGSTEGVIAAGVSAQIMTALSVMGLLVQVEERNRSLEDELNMAQATKESLCDCISTLETQHWDAGDHASINIGQNLNLMMAKMRQLQCSIETIDKHTSKVARHFSAEPETRGFPRIQTQINISQSNSQTLADSSQLSPTSPAIATHRQGTQHSNYSHGVLTSPNPPSLLSTLVARAGLRGSRYWQIESTWRRLWVLFNILIPMALLWAPANGDKLGILFLYAFYNFVFWLWTIDYQSLAN